MEKESNKPMLCTLEEDINRCAQYDRENGICRTNNTKCAFCKENVSDSPSGYVRKPRWYEKYYK